MINKSIRLPSKNEYREYEKEQLDKLTKVFKKQISLSQKLVSISNEIERTYLVSSWDYKTRLSLDGCRIVQDSKITKRAALEKAVVDLRSLVKEVR